MICYTYTKRVIWNLKNHVDTIEECFQAWQNHRCKLPSAAQVMEKRNRTMPAAESGSSSGLTARANVARTHWTYVSAYGVFTYISCFLLLGNTFCSKGLKKTERSKRVMFSGSMQLIFLINFWNVAPVITCIPASIDIKGIPSTPDAGKASKSM